MTKKINYIKRSSKYIIGAAVLATGLSSAIFGLDSNGYYYLIRTKQDLIDFRDLVNSGKEPDAKGRLENSIKFNEDKVVEGGKLKGVKFDEWEPIGSQNYPFEGEFTAVDNGTEKKEITGLYINKEGNNYQGLFGWIEEKGKVSCITVSNSYIKGDEEVGAISGYNKGEIMNCKTNDNIIEGTNNVGGIVGSNGDGIPDSDKNAVVNFCFNFGTTVNGKENVGGIVGYNYKNGVVEECSAYKSENEAIGKVKGECSVGGNVGRNEGNIKNCHNSLIVEGTYNLGGNVGYNDGDITSCSSNEGTVKGSYDFGNNVGCSYKEINEEELSCYGNESCKKIGTKFYNY